MAQLDGLLGGILAFFGLLVGILGVGVSFIGAAVETGTSRPAASL